MYASAARDTIQFPDMRATPTPMPKTVARMTPTTETVRVLTNATMKA